MQNMILWHIPRTGTTSLRHAAYEAGIKELRDTAWSADAGCLQTYHHMTPSDVLVLGLATVDQIRNTPSVLMVRNTWERLVSLYHLFHQRGGPGLRAIAAKFGPDFESYLDWCMYGVREVSRHEANYQCRPQIEWLRSLSLTCHIVQHPNVPMAWDSICRHFGTKGELPLHNSSSHRPYQTYYTKEYRDKVADHYHKEIERFGFTFD